ncbi:transposase [Streptomyces sp. NPDC059496]|uniref:transposase n=1 Tax=Streptomyces sp. NPDC059496 TaxID=3346851 RepID=UPI00367CA34B
MPKNPPESMQDHLRHRLNVRAKERWPQLARVQVRFHSGFAYVAGEPPGEEEPLPLCRLRFTGVLHTWGFALYPASRGKYEDNFLLKYSGTLGKVGNCQIGVSVHAASDTASCPLSWRLFLPESWDRAEAAARRKACRIPETEHHRPKWQLALDMLDELAGTGLRPAALVADSDYGANADFRHGLEDRGLAYVLQVKGEMTAHGEDAEPHRPA